MELSDFDILVIKVNFLFGKDVADKVIFYTSDPTKINATIKNSFLWCPTTEGHEYWNNIHKELVEWELDMRFLWGIQWI